MDILTCSAPATERNKSFLARMETLAIAKQEARSATAAYPETADDWLELTQAFWRAARVLKKMDMRDVEGKKMWSRFVEHAQYAAEQYRAALK